MNRVPFPVLFLSSSCSFRTRTEIRLQKLCFWKKNKNIKTTGVLFIKTKGVLFIKTKFVHIVFPFVKSETNYF